MQLPFGTITMSLQLLIELQKVRLDLLLLDIEAASVQQQEVKRGDATVTVWRGEGGRFGKKAGTGLEMPAEGLTYKTAPSILTKINFLGIADAEINKDALGKGLTQSYDRFVADSPEVISGIADQIKQDVDTLADLSKQISDLLGPPGKTGLETGKSRIPAHAKAAIQKDITDSIGQLIGMIHEETEPAGRIALPETDFQDVSQQKGVSLVNQGVARFRERQRRLGALTQKVAAEKDALVSLNSAFEAIDENPSLTSSAKAELSRSIGDAIERGSRQFVRDDHDEEWTKTLEWPRFAYLAASTGLGLMATAAVAAIVQAGAAVGPPIIKSGETVGTPILRSALNKGAEIRKQLEQKPAPQPADSATAAAIAPLGPQDTRTTIEPTTATAVDPMPLGPQDTRTTIKRQATAERVSPKQIKTVADSFIDKLKKDVAMARKSLKEKTDSFPSSPDLAAGQETIEKAIQFLKSAKLPDPNQIWQSMSNASVLKDVMSKLPPVHFSPLSKASEQDDND